MKKNTILLLVIFLSLLFVAGCGTMGSCGCGGKEEKKENKSIESKEQKKDIYACPMGCSESDKPGNCPKCGMKLEKK